MEPQLWQHVSTNSRQGLHRRSARLCMDPALLSESACLTLLLPCAAMYGDWRVWLATILFTGFFYWMLTGSCGMPALVGEPCCSAQDLDFEMSCMDELLDIPSQCDSHDKVLKIYGLVWQFDSIAAAVDAISRSPPENKQDILPLDHVVLATFCWWPRQQRLLRTRSDDCHAIHCT